jgi:hypothetical protein
VRAPEIIALCTGPGRLLGSDAGVSEARAAWLTLVTA